MGLTPVLCNRRIAAAWLAQLRHGNVVRRKAPIELSREHQIVCLSLGLSPQPWIDSARLVWAHGQNHRDPRVSQSRARSHIERRGDPSRTATCQPPSVAGRVPLRLQATGFGILRKADVQMSTVLIVLYSRHEHVCRGLGAALPCHHRQARESA